MILALARSVVRGLSQAVIPGAWSAFPCNDDCDTAGVRLFRGPSLPPLGFRRVGTGLDEVRGGVQLASGDINVLKRAPYELPRGRAEEVFEGNER